MSLFGLLALLVSICGLASAQFLNSTSTPTITAAPSLATGECSSNCSVEAKPPNSYYWQSFSVNETITAATLVVIVNTKYNITTTSLQVADLPSGITVPDVNDKGTHVTTITYARNGKPTTTVLAFPTEFVQWDDGYTWSGVLVESTAAGQNVCVTATSSYVPFTSFPQEEQPTMPTHQAGPDPEGWYFKATSEGADIQYYVDVFTDQPAWQQCSHPSVPAPIEVAYTAKFMTATLTSFDDAWGTPAPGSSAAAGRPSPTPEKPSFVPVPIASAKPEDPSSAAGQSPVATPNPTPVTPGHSDNSPPPQVIPIGSETLHLSTGGGSTAVILPDGQTLKPGNTATVGGKPVFIPTSAPGAGIVVGSATVTFPPPAASVAPGAIVVGSNTIPVSLAPASSEGGIVLPNGGTLKPGSATEVDGTSFSLGPSGTALVVDGNTVSFDPTSASNIVVGSSTIQVAPVTAAPGGQGLILPNSETLLPGSSTTIDGTVISLAPSGTAVVVDGSTVPIPDSAPSSAFAFATASNGGLILADGETLLPGSATTIDGTVISLAPSGTALVIDGSTVPINPATTSAFAYVTASNGGVILPNSQTLMPGSATTIDGTTWSVDPSGSLYVADPATMATATTTGSGAGWQAQGTNAEASSTSKGPGDYVWQGIGGNGQEPAKGEAGAIGRGLMRVWFGSAWCVGVIAVLL